MIISVDNNLFLGAVRGTAKLMGLANGPLPEDDYSFMLAKTMVDTVFTVYFTSKAIDKFLQSGICLGVAIASAGAGAIAALPTGGTSAIVGVGIAEVAIKEAAISMVMAVVAEAGAIHSQHLLGEDTEKLRNAKRNKGTGKSIDIKNPVLENIRTGSALKTDALHAFNDVMDNYASYAQKFKLVGADKVTRQLYQIEGSLNGKKGIFEWIVDPDVAKGVTHRRFIQGVGITGKPNAIPKK